MLPDNELQELLSHTDPKVAGAAKKLKDLKDSGQYIPKAKFDELNTKLANAKAESETAIAEAQRKLTEAEQRATAAAASGGAAAQEASRLAEQRKAELEALKAEHEKIKPLATNYENYRKAKVTTLKEKLGDKFLPEYEGFSVESLEKLIGAAGETQIDTDGHQPGKIFTKPVSDQSPAEIEKTIADAKAGRLNKGAST